MFYTTTTGDFLSVQLVPDLLPSCTTCGAGCGGREDSAGQRRGAWYRSVWRRPHPQLLRPCRLSRFWRETPLHLAQRGLILVSAAV